MNAAQLALTGAGIPPSLCGHVRVQATDRAGQYRYVCVRRPHPAEIPHQYTWLTEMRPIVAVATTGEVL